MIYIIIALTFSLFVLSPVKFNLYFYKKGSDEHMEISVVYLRVIKVDVKVPEMSFDIKNMIPFMTFKVNLSNRRIKKVKKTEKVVFSPLRFRIGMALNFIKRLFAQIKRFKPVIRVFLKTIKINKFDIGIKFGVKDPAIAGIIAGGIWSFIYFILSVMSYYFDFERVSSDITVFPLLLKTEPAQIVFKGIIQVRVGHIIITGLFIPVMWLISRRSYFNARRAKEYGWTSN